MGVRGRKPKPAALAVLQGNPGRRPVAAGGGSDLKSLPSAPPGLHPLAVEEWDRIGGGLVSSGVLLSRDLPLLQAYVSVYARWIEAERHVTEHGAVVKTPRTGIPMVNPFEGVANRALKLLREYGNELGISPSARARAPAGGSKPPPSAGGGFASMVKKK